jgi:hypothetical protein
MSPFSAIRFSLAMFGGVFLSANILRTCSDFNRFFCIVVRFFKKLKAVSTLTQWVAVPTVRFTPRVLNIYLTVVHFFS